MDVIETTSIDYTDKGSARAKAYLAYRRKLRLLDADPERRERLRVRHLELQAARLARERLDPVRREELAVRHRRAVARHRAKIKADPVLYEALKARQREVKREAYRADAEKFKARVAAWRLANPDQVRKTSRDQWTKAKAEKTKADRAGTVKTLRPTAVDYLGA